MGDTGTDKEGKPVRSKQVIIMSVGNMQWDLVKKDGTLKIRELNYGRTRGDD
jgi:hypothetical protein